MRRIQDLSWSAFIAFFGALVFGFRDVDKDFFQIDTKLYFYAVFILILRFKIALDDSFYFGISELRRWQSRLGLIFAAVFWILSIFAAYSIGDPGNSYLLFLLALGLSTIWIVVVAYRDGFYREQLFWIISNSVYLMGLGVLLWFERAPDIATQTIQAAILQYHFTPHIVLSCLIIFVFVDYFVSKSLDHARH